MGSTRLATLPRRAASLLPLVYSLLVRYGARVRKPTAPEQLYIDFDGFFAACEEQADRRLQGRPLAVIPFAGAVQSCVIAANTMAKRAGALVRGCGQAYALQTVAPVTYRCGTVSFPVKRTVRKETGRPLKASAET